MHSVGNSQLRYNNVLKLFSAIVAAETATVVKRTHPGARFSDSEQIHHVKKLPPNFHQIL